MDFYQAVHLFKEVSNVTYFIGIDIAKFKHDCFIMDHNGEVIHNSFTFKNDKAAFDYFYSIIQKLDPNQEKR